jgi:hypothetical protein
MSKTIVEGEDKKPSILAKITAYLKSNKSEAKADDKKTDDEDVEEDDEKEKDASETEADSTDDDDLEDDNDDDTEDDDDDATMEVNGETVNLKDTAAVRQAIESLQATNAEQIELLTAAQTELGKSKEQVKNDIKSEFVPNGSNRSNKSAKEKPVADWAKPEEGSIAANAVKGAIASKKK